MFHSAERTAITMPAQAGRVQAASPAHSRMIGSLPPQDSDYPHAANADLRTLRLEHRARAGRKTHATLSVEAGVIGDAVAASLGHGSFAVTAGHYAKPEAITSARTHQIEIW